MPPNLQNSKLHKKLKFNNFILVRFSVFVFWWQKIVFGVDCLIRVKNNYLFTFQKKTSQLITGFDI